MRTYLDHAATSPLRPSARQALLAALDEWGNPASPHRTGQRARRLLEEAREELAEAVGAHPSEVVFTSGGSEANTLALLGSRSARPERPRCLVSAVEHPAVLTLRALGAEVLPVDAEGVVVPTSLTASEDTVAVVSVMMVNNETGAIQPIADVAERAHASGAWFHSDAVQGLGHVPVRFADTGADLLSLSAHKIGGPVGVGALLVRRGIRLRAAGLGGGQEGGVRSGTQTVALARAFAAAATEAVATLRQEMPRLTRLRDAIRALVLQHGGTLNGPERAAPHIVNASFPGVRAQDLLLLLDEAGIDATAGAACRAGVRGPSEVLLAMGRDEATAASSVRFSLGHTSGEADVTHLAEALPRVLDRARGAR